MMQWCMSGRPGPKTYATNVFRILALLADLLVVVHDCIVAAQYCSH